MTNNERIIEKIKKVLELAKNNPSQEEAKSAVLKAQKLMAEYHIAMSDIESVGNIDKIDEVSVMIGKGNKWKYFLVSTISKNFRCKNYYNSKEEVVFYGYKNDAIIASETFKFLFDFGKKTSASYYNKLRNKSIKTKGYFNGTGIKNSFLYGFVNGVKDVLERQSTALMIIVPIEVENKYIEKTSGWKNFNCSLKYNNNRIYGEMAQEEGYKQGKNAIQSRQIETC